MKLAVGVSSSSKLSASDEALVNRAMRDAISDSVEFFSGRYKNTINRKTSKTASTIRGVVVGGGSHVAGHVGSDDRVAKLLEEGTPPHVIRPRFKKALFWPGARHPVKSVRHPGTRSYEPLLRASRSAGPYTKTQLQNVYPKVFGG